MPKETEKSRSRRGRGMRFVLTAGLLGGAVLTELAKPAADRTWEGRLAGFVPYDLRRPTLARFRERVWNPSDRHVLVPTVFGIGWTVNLASAVERSTSLLSKRSATA